MVNGELLTIILIGVNHFTIDHYIIIIFILTSRGTNFNKQKQTQWTESRFHSFSATEVCFVKYDDQFLEILLNIPNYLLKVHSLQIYKSFNPFTL